MAEKTAAWGEDMESEVLVHSVLFFAEFSTRREPEKQCSHSQGEMEETPRAGKANGKERDESETDMGEYVNKSNRQIIV